MDDVFLGWAAHRQIIEDMLKDYEDGDDLEELCEEYGIFIGDLTYDELELFREMD